ncbi:spore germination protein [Ferroacidibacillus organovorans]|nr:spore germination protein [Ferroacidibacillus organovorans]
MKYKKRAQQKKTLAPQNHDENLVNRQENRIKNEKSGDSQKPSEFFLHSVFTKELEPNLALFENALGSNMDLLIRRFTIELNDDLISCGLVHLDGSSSKTDINDILAALMFTIDQSQQRGTSAFRVIYSQCIPYADVAIKNSPREAADWIIAGNSILFLDGYERVIGLSTQAFKERAVEQSQTEQVIQGSREAFIESIGTNVSLIRKRMRSTDLKVHKIQIGEETATNVAFCYLEGIANEALVNEVKKRLEVVKTDSLYGSGYLEQFIEDSPFSPFPQVQNTERPDKAVASILEGRVAILVDGSPFCLIVPAVFSQFYQTTEDYDTRFLMASLIRAIRLISLLFALIFPSVYVSLIEYNPEMIPTKFAVAVAGGRAGVPFPAIVEIFGLEIIMEILREATIRLPQQIGGALSIVGVLVIGEAAVNAGFVSPITVVVVSLTTIGSFATPAYNAAIALRMLRFPLMIISGIFGLYGVMVGIILITNHLIKLESFGVPYLSPLLPGNKFGFFDSIIRAPVWMMSKRPEQLQTGKATRIKVNQETLKNQKGRPLAPQYQNISENSSTSSTPNDESNQP